MDALILAGGRGKRLGALTTHYPKAVLCFAGKLLLGHALEIIVASEKIERIFVATGYKSTTVEHTVSREVESFSTDKQIVVLPQEEQLRGAFKSMVRGFQSAGIKHGCLVIGVDAVVTRTAMSNFLTKAQEEQVTTFMVSPILSTAPTHGLVRFGENKRIVEYRKKTTASIFEPSRWYSDVGIRYFSATFVNECHYLSLGAPCDFDDIIPGLVREGFVFNAHILRERWLHFGVGRDFKQKPLTKLLEF